MLHGTHDTTLVALSVLIATVASYTALDLAARIRECSGWSCTAWLATAALAMGGGIWSMHFVAMLAFSMPGMEVSYDMGLTLLSLVVPILVTGVAFHVVSRKETGPVALLLSGLVMGLSVVAMHYTGMAAMRMTAHLSYDRLWVAVSVLIAIGASTVALWLAFRRTGPGLKLVASVAMGLAISGMHYAAMQGAVFTGHAAVDGAHGYASIGQMALALAVTAATFLILFLALVAAMFDRRFALLAAREANAIRQSEERMRLMLQSVTDYAIFMLDPEGRVANWNAGAQQMKGYEAAEIIGSHLSRFYTHEDHRAGLAETALKTAASDGKFKAEGWRVRKNGSRFWASVVIDPVKDEAGHLIGFVKVTRDVTQRKEAEEALRKAQDALFQAQKMEAIGQLTGGIAHDFNNLLMAVLGSLELLRKRVPDEPKVKRLLENAMQAAQRGASLTQRMLAFARRQDLNPTAVDVPDLVRGMTELLQRSIGPAVRIDARFPPDLPRVRVDGNQLELALLNLAVNARDAMPDGGTMAIAARQGKGSELEDGGLEAEADYVCLQVKDTGEGMDEATLIKAKEPFFTTKGVGKGTGLGLSMVHGLAEQSNGRLLLKSRKGVGTTAEIWLPVAGPADVEQEPQAPNPATKRPGRPLTVLVVDDDPIVLQNTAAMLDDMGHRVIESVSAENALSVLRARSVDLLVMDQVMPGMTGLQLAKVVRNEWPQVTIILATGYAEIPADGGPSVPRLNKPFTGDMLAETISRAMEITSLESKVVSLRSR